LVICFSPKVTGKILGKLDVFCLGALIATSEKNNKYVALAYEIDPVARAITNPKLRDTFSYWTDITWISQG
jgi:hypothetical protein